MNDGKCVPDESFWAGQWPGTNVLARARSTDLRRTFRRRWRSQVSRSRTVWIEHQTDVASIT
jgi:hypothetical protein